MNFNQMPKEGEALDKSKANYKSLADNLRDAGCEPEAIILFLRLCDDGKTSDQLSLLTEHRKKLLNEIHTEQAKLDCLDYLIYQLRKEQAVYHM